MSEITVSSPDGRPRQAPEGDDSKDACAQARSQFVPLVWMAILAAALIWRLFGITTTEVWRDEAITIAYRHCGWLQLMKGLPWIEDTPPLIFLIYKLWAGISANEVWLRVFPLITGTAAVHVIMATARLAGSRAWWAAGLLAAFSPVPIHYSQEIRVYSLLFLSTASCFWAAEKLLVYPQRKRWLFGLLLLGALTAHLHAVGIFVFPAVVAGLLVRREGKSCFSREFLLAGLGWIILALPMIWFARHWSLVRMGQVDWWVHRPSLRGTRYLAESLFGMNILGQWAIRSSWPGMIWAGFVMERLLICGAGCLLAAGLWNRDTRRSCLAYAAAALVFCTLMLVSSLVGTPNMAVRTMLPIWCPVLLCLSLGVAVRQPRQLGHAAKVSTVALAGIMALGWCWNVWRADPLRPRSREMFAWMQAGIGPEDLIYSTPDWFEDLAAYHLSESISGEQLVREVRSYAGRPARHLVPVEKRPDWFGWFESLVQDRLRRGVAFSIWIVKYQTLKDPQPGTPEHYLWRRFKPIEQISRYEDLPVGISRLDPRAAPGNSASSPAE